jgi:ArsR family transcriptional regulator, arsenate/arsenite/antimonite-responsive transcriptional repressor / arsenate reductase (thioredoxin)
MRSQSTAADDPLADAGLLRRARMHAALGEPVRLAMVQHLLITDASPGELGASYGLATNALAHHLKVLQTTGLIRRAKSEGDARRSYVQLRLDDPEVMALVNPDEGRGSASRKGPSPLPGQARPQRVVFVCTANSARSQIAAAAWQQISHLPVASAGTHPAPRVHPRAVAVGRRHGLHIAGTRTARLGDIAAAGDLVVCVCDNAHEELPATGPAAIGAPMVGRVHWAVPDPVRIDTDEAFEAAYVQLAGRVERLARSLDTTSTPPA